MLGEALTKHKKSVIFRKEQTQLRDIIERSKEIIGDPRKLNESLHIWRGLPGGRSLEFGGIADLKDINKWRGRPHDLKGFDEATEFLESVVRLMMAWNRSTDPLQKCQTILTFNPPTTAEGRWVIPFFGPWLDPQHPHPAQPGELRWYARIDDKDVECPNGEAFEHKGETIKPTSRTFIPARVTDNPFLANTDYVTKLQSLPEPLRSQLLYGDFNAGIKDDEWQVIPTEWVKLAQARWLARQAKGEGRPVDEHGTLTPLSSLGVDVAHGGDDESVLSPRYDNWFDELIVYPGKQTPNGAHLAKNILTLLLQRGEATVTDKPEIEYKDFGFVLPIVTSSVPVNIDVIGWGSDCYGVCRTQGITARAINVGEGSKARDKSGKFGFVNKRAEFIWRLREALDPVSGENLALPPDSVLLADLTALRYKPQSNGYLIEPKEDLKKRLGRSPDRGEAVMLAYAQTRLQIFLGGST